MPLNTFLKKLEDNKIDVLVDVRTLPQSRFCPHFNKNALQSELAKRDIQYHWKGMNLGGKGVNVGYEEAIDELVSMTNKGKKVCVMCSEGDYHKCHRYTDLMPSLEDQGLTMHHIEYEKNPSNKTS